MLRRNLIHRGWLAAEQTTIGLGASMFSGYDLSREIINYYVVFVVLNLDER